MSQFRTVRWGAAVAITTMLTVTACGGSGFSGGSGGHGAGATGSAGGSKGQVRMLVNITPNLTKQFWQQLVKPFEAAHPGVTVKIEAPATSVKETLPQLLAAGDAPDVVETLQADSTLAPEMVDLSDQSWVSQTPMAKQSMIGGKAYSVGVGLQAQSIVYYNKDAFAKAHIASPPKTLSEFGADMAKLKAAGYLPLQSAGDYVTGLQFLELADPSVFTKYPNWYADIASKKVTAGATFKPLLESYAGWLKKDYLDKNALGLDDTTGPANFLKGKSAMYIMGSWFAKTVDDTKPSFSVGAFAAPTADGQSSPGPQGVSVAAPYMVLKSTKHRTLATDLVHWLVTNKGAVQKQLRQDGNFRTGFTGGLTPLGAEIQKILDTAPSQVPHPEGFGETRVPQGFAAEVNTLVQGLYTGKSPADVANGIDSWVRKQK